MTARVGEQRAAIAARDGGCIIPGCTIPARWTEVHHIIPAGKGGPTNVDNGTNLCWFHHHTIDTNGWQIRMINGRPQVRGPLLWDPTQTWRPAREGFLLIPAELNHPSVGSNP
ncbi:HNH endonuclease signature motif containing protein [Cryobacterium luteum]|uniref:HNH endonuclease n=1 Tax=Cryobacterium luteum TaxID=1424661 RepID=A0A1H8FGZ9_9MICO|nr:HNH endonuclease signature motif containing protein [Cryobacterium luteum]TFB93360.1 HNH endonuclease [Cryobacterium luteum]SEN30915.1 HNH endonuclease [Cryobacterium luteum]